MKKLKDYAPYFIYSLCFLLIEMVWVGPTALIPASMYSGAHETSSHQHWNVKVTLLLLYFAWLSYVEESDVQGFMSLNVPSVIYNYNYNYNCR